MRSTTRSAIALRTAVGCVTLILASSSSNHRTGTTADSDLALGLPFREEPVEYLILRPRGIGQALDVGAPERLGLKIPERDEWHRATWCWCRWFPGHHFLHDHGGMRFTSSTIRKWQHAR